MRVECCGFWMADAFGDLGIMRVRGLRFLKTLRRGRRSGRVACWRCAFNKVVVIRSSNDGRGIYFLEVTLIGMIMSWQNLV